MTKSISKHDEIINSRDIIERIEELESERQALIDTVDSTKEAWEDEDGDEKDARRDDYEAAQGDVQEWDENDEGQELTALLALQDEAEGYADDWKYGATLIHEDYFTDYCKDMLTDIGDLPKDLPGYIVIDWEQTAENLKVDYTAVDFDGETFYVR